MDALQMWNDYTEEKLTSVLKAKFKAILMRGGQDNKYSVANQEIIFSKIKNLGSILEKIGEVFLCNMEMNLAPTYLNLENIVCLNVNVTEKNITAVSLQTTICGLRKGENMLISHDLTLSSDGEDEPTDRSKTFLKCNAETESTPKYENSSYFSPNSDDELAKYLNSEVMTATISKKKKQKTPIIRLQKL